MVFLAAIQDGGSILGLFSNNLINWMVLVGLLVWLWSKYMPPVFAARKEQIERALQDAAQAKADGEEFLATQKKKLAQAEKESDNIVAEAKQVAIEMQKGIETQTEKDLADFATRIDQEIVKQRQMAISELRHVAAKAAIALAQEALPAAVTDASRAKLMSQFVDQLDALDSREKAVTRN
jgi:F-type H+-transporting ATPase subunit b